MRKTAAVCVAKLYDINAQLAEDQGFLDLLRDLLSDSNPMVSRELEVLCLGLKGELVGWSGRGMIMLALHLCTADGRPKVS